MDHQGSHHAVAHEGDRAQHHDVHSKGAEDAGLEQRPPGGEAGADGHVVLQLRDVVPGSRLDTGAGSLVALNDLQGIFCAHGKEQGQSHKERCAPDKGNEQLHRAGPGHGLEAEGVADGHVPLKAERGHVQHRGIAAGLEEEVVELAGNVAIGGGKGAPDGTEEFHGHAQQDDQQVGAGQAHHVVSDLLLQVAFPLQDPGDFDGDAVAQEAGDKDADVDQGQGDLDPQSHLKLWDVAVVDERRTV